MYSNLLPAEYPKVKRRTSTVGKDKLFTVWLKVCWLKVFQKYCRSSVEVGQVMEVLTDNTKAGWVYKMLDVSFFLNNGD